MTAAQATAERDRVLDEVQRAHRLAVDAGIEVLRERAAAGHPFSANDVRADLHAAGCPPSSIGGVFNAAIKAKVIRRVGWEPSNDLGTHAKPVARYVAADQTGGGLKSLIPTGEQVTVPVRRTPAGRFTAPPDGDTPSLFDLPEGATA